MGDVGLLLSLPTESIAVRVALASVVALLAARLLARGWVSTRRSRAALALVPPLAVMLVVVASLTAPQLPTLWYTIEGSSGLTVPVRDTYLSFTRSPLPFILGVWAVIAVVRVAVSVARQALGTRELRRLAAAGTVPPPRVNRIVERLSSAMRLRAPETRVVEGLRGGGVVVGMSSTQLLLDASLLASLDDEELTGVIAHELAHVQRRDNLVAFGLRVVRDAVFFVPGGRWSVAMLLREREHAADAVAVEVTGRPAALAGGLLKVLETRGVHAAAACAPLLSEGTLIARVEELIDDRPAPSTARRAAEGTAVTVATVIAVVAAVALPARIVGPAQEREALGVLLSDVGRSSAPASTDRAVVFRSFDGAAGVTTSPDPSVLEESPSEDVVLLDVGDVDLAGATGYAACERRASVCAGGAAPRVSLRPPPVLRVDDGTVRAWRLEPILRSDTQESALFWMTTFSAG